jgi:hypothetical protein
VDLASKASVMRYEHFLGGMVGVQPRFKIVVDETEPMRWYSDPEGHDIPEAMTLFFRQEGSAGSGRPFTVYPGGRAEPG